MLKQKFYILQADDIVLFVSKKMTLRCQISLVYAVFASNLCQKGNQRKKKSTKKKSLSDVYALNPCNLAPFIVAQCLAMPCPCPVSLSLYSCLHFPFFLYKPS